MIDRNDKKTDDEKSEPRVGVYVRHCGGNISDVVDVNRVVETAAKIPGV
jgi:heterodisulfide reductase subunit A2